MYYWLTVVIVWLAQRYNQGRPVILRCEMVSGTWKMPAHVIPCFIYWVSFFFPFFKMCFRRLTISAFSSIVATACTLSLVRQLEAIVYLSI